MAKRTIAKALVNPINLGVAAGAATLAVGLGSMSLGALGTLAYAALVAYDAVAGPKPPRGVELPDPKHLEDDSARDAVVQIIAARRDLEAVLARTPADVLATLSETLSSLDELESYAARLAYRAEDLHRHLATARLPELVAEVKQLNARIDATHDDAAKKTFEEAKAARMDDLRTLKELKTAKERIDASLMRVAALLCGLPSKIVHMRALDAQAMDRISGDMTEELAAVGRELKLSEAVMKQLGEVTR
jgi:hypothetical protein